MAQVETAEAELLDALRAGQESAFTALVQQYQPSILRVARIYVQNPATAEEVAQETWVAVLDGLDRFEGRSSLKTWIFRILANIARTRAQRDGRSLPFSSFGEESGGPAVDPDRFAPAGERWAGHWKSYPERWDTVPEERLLGGEARRRVESAIRRLPPAQQQVVTLRDIEGWSAEEVCSALEISEANQRVLLHRARSKVRQALEAYLAQG
ncbi:MAG TPA: sigma-70 family RNA polymerase sigma factor [Gaiellaceae bacterium]|nr:sigma-70 family RNA polymerase sigma factor [Gaiellaceae bacterium]